MVSRCKIFAKITGEKEQSAKSSFRIIDKKPTAIKL